MPVLITGYPYIRENYFNTLRVYPEKDKLFFLLPREWKIKSGKVVYQPPKDANVSTAKAYFYHSNYPIIGGLLKGWMPGFLSFIFKERKKKNIRAVVTLTEPILLTTLYQAIISKILGLKHFLFTWENIAYEDKFSGFNLAFKQLIIKLNLLFSDGIICGNKKAVEIFKKYTKKPTPNIPFAGIDTDFFKSEKKEKIWRGQDLRDKTIFSFVGALEYRKGVHLILNAFKEVVAKMPNAYLIIAGTGEEKYEKDLDNRIKQHNLESYISKVAWINHDELRHIFAITDVFVYPSQHYGGWEEQLGYLLMEASAAGLAIVSTDSGSINEVIINEDTGLLVKTDDTLGLSRAMLRLAGDSELRIRLGIKAREHICKNFSREVISGKFYEFFKNYD